MIKLVATEIGIRKLMQ